MKPKLFMYQFIFLVGTYFSKAKFSLVNKTIHTSFQCTIYLQQSSMYDLSH